MTTPEQQQQQEEFATNYTTQFEWPAYIQSTRTNPELVQHRLLEAGVLYDVPVTVGDTVQAVSKFVQDLESTGHFHAVHVELGGDSTTTPQQPQRLTVKLDEKNWYKLYAGAGLKHSQTGFAKNVVSDNRFLPTAELEAKFALRNLTGYLETTELNYALDTQQITSWSLQHGRPLYSVFDQRNGLTSWLRDAILLLPDAGSQYWLETTAALDTVDWRSTRSFQEYQRLASVSAQTNRHKQPWHVACTWSLLWSDLIPKRHATLPFQFAASPQVVSQAGSRVKHSIALQLQGTLPADAQTGVDAQSSRLEYQIATELATPPGDVGFNKTQAKVAVHVPLWKGIQMQLSGSVGYLHSLQFGGLCRPPGLSDAFLLGGPIQFRGFSPAGIGPRAANGQQAGDALGANFYYSVTSQISVPTRIPGIRLFGFGTVGTCSNICRNVWTTSRMSTGIGVETYLLGPRIEVSYAWPLRHGPMDHCKSFQWGVSVE